MAKIEFRPYESRTVAQVKGYLHWPGRVEPFEPEPDGKKQSTQSYSMVPEKQATPRQKIATLTREQRTQTLE